MILRPGALGFWIVFQYFTHSFQLQGYCRLFLFFSPHDFAARYSWLCGPSSGNIREPSLLDPLWLRFSFTHNFRAVDGQNIYVQIFGFKCSDEKALPQWIQKRWLFVKKRFMKKRFYWKNAFVKKRFIPTATLSSLALTLSQTLLQLGYNETSRFQI